MANLILYYSRTGTTKAYAEKVAAETGAAPIEVREPKKRNGFTAFIPGTCLAMGRKGSAIEPIDADLAAYDEITIMGPIWGGCPAPAVNSAIDLLPAGKDVSLIGVSERGGYDLAKTAALITAKGCTVKEARCLGKNDL